MHFALQKYRYYWKQRAYLGSVCYGVAVFIVSLVCFTAARRYLSHNYEHIVSSPDFLLDRFSAIPVDAVLIWGVPILFALITCALLLHPDRLPFALKALGVLLIVRAFFIILTPMGFRADQAITSPEGFLQQLAYSNDFFFSGHVSIPFLFAFIFWDERWIRYVMFSISGIFAACVLLAHTHYSIDVFVVPFIVPTVYRFSLWFFGSDREPFAEAFSPSFAGSTSLL